jgi:ornithine--oxo-acid transaminase
MKIPKNKIKSKDEKPARKAAPKLSKKTEKLIKEVEKYGAHNYHPLPIVITQGQGVWVKDVDKKKYLDCLSAYSALNQGHRHPKIVNAMKDQAQKITITSRAFHNEVMGEFLQKLCEVTKMEMALPMNTGVEAVETALKLARRWGYERKKVHHDTAEIIVCENNFHGRTTTVVGFSSEVQYKRNFGPFGPGFKSVPYGNIEALKAAINEHTVAILMEPIQGEGGVIVPPAGYLSATRKLCDEKSVLFMLDEIQTGLGRTGKLFAYQHEKEAKPDILILGKALGGGVIPVSAVVSSHEILSLFRPGDHGSTFGGYPLACAVGLASLEVIVKEKLAEKAAVQGKYFMKALSNIKSPHVKEVRGKGLMIGVEIFQKSGLAREFCEKLSHVGILAKDTHEQTIRFTPPLIITKKEIDWAVKQIRKVLTE